MTEPPPRAVAVNDEPDSMTRLLAFLDDLNMSPNDAARLLASRQQRAPGVSGTPVSAMVLLPHATPLVRPTYATTFEGVLEQHFQLALSTSSCSLQARCLLCTRLLRFQTSGVQVPHDEYVRGYVRELWLSELAPKPTIDTAKLLSFVPHDKEMFTRELHLMDSAADANAHWQCMCNLFMTAKHYFQQSPSLSVEPTQMTLFFLLKDVHGKLMEGLIDSPGMLRRLSVAPLGSMVNYASWNKVPQHLAVLCNQTNEAFAKIVQIPDRQHRLLTALVVAAVFFSNFMWIHPFIDGNGRTGRLLLSIILRGFTIVPISLYLCTDARGSYVGSLEEAHRNPDTYPTPVVQYVMQSAYQTAESAARLAL